MVYQMPGTNVVQPVQFGATYKEGKAIEKIAKAEEKKDGNKRLAATAACVAAAAIAGINLAKKGKLGKAAQEFMGGAANNAKLGNQVGQQIADEAAEAVQKVAVKEGAEAAQKTVQKTAAQEAAEALHKNVDDAAAALDKASRSASDAQQVWNDILDRKHRGLPVSDEDFEKAKAGVQGAFKDKKAAHAAFDEVDGTAGRRRIAALQKEQQEIQQKLDRETRKHDEISKTARARLEEIKRWKHTNEQLVADNSKANKRIGELQAQVDALRNSSPVTSSAAKFTTGNGMSIEFDLNKSIDENFANIQKFVKKNKRFYQSAKKQMIPIREYVEEQIKKHPTSSRYGSFYRQLHAKML